MEFKIENTVVYGATKSAIASGNPMRTKMKDNCGDMTIQDLKRAEILGNTGIGEGHDQFLTGVVVQFDIYAPLYMWKEIQRYHFLDFVSSQSTMHCMAKFDIKKRCVSDTDPIVIDRVQELVNEYNAQEVKDKELWRKIIASCPCGFILGATMTTNYRQIKTIYNQRKNHKLKEWHEFCAWAEELPYFKQWCIKEEEQSN